MSQAKRPSAKEMLVVVVTPATWYTTTMEAVKSPQGLEPPLFVTVKVPFPETMLVISNRSLQKSILSVTMVVVL